MLDGKVDESGKSGVDDAAEFYARGRIDDTPDVKLETGDLHRWRHRSSAVFDFFQIHFADLVVRNAFHDDQRLQQWIVKPITKLPFFAVLVEDWATPWLAKFIQVFGKVRNLVPLLHDHAQGFADIGSVEKPEFVHWGHRTRKEHFVEDVSLLRA